MFELNLIDNMKNITNIVSSFEPLQIKKYNCNLFSKRYDSKFFLYQQLLESILMSSVDSYNILEVQKKRIQHYRSLYFDNEKFSFYSAHHNGELNRFKIRLRKYNDVPNIFIEVKYKNNKCQSIKWRKKVNADILGPSIISKHKKSFIENYIGDAFGILLPKVLIDYERITLIPKSNKAERITIDFNIKCFFDGMSKNLTNITIVEIKQRKVDCRSPFFLIMRKNNVYQTNFSKYCFGINYLYPYLKNNRFKPRNQKINKVNTGSINS